MSLEWFINHPEELGERTFQCFLIGSQATASMKLIWIMDEMCFIVNTVSVCTIISINILIAAIFNLIHLSQLVIVKGLTDFVSCYD